MSATPEELKARETQARREYPETKAAFARVRDAMVQQLFRTPLGGQAERERLYSSVQILDAVEKALIDAMGQGSEAIDEFIKNLATTEQ